MIINIIMFHQLKNILEESKIRFLKDQQLGRAIELLKSIQYFSELVDKYGSEYLIIIFPALQSFILRERSDYINTEDVYILVEGNLVEQSQTFTRIPFKSGYMIQLKQTYKSKLLALTDCQMIRIKRKKMIASKISKKVMQIQQQKNKKIKQLQKSAEANQDKVNFYKEIKQFRNFGKYEALQIISKSQLKEYQANSQIYSYGQCPNKIGYIATGKVKLIYNEPAISKHKNNSSQFSINYCQGEWLCLEQCISQEQNLKHSCQVKSIEARIFWIPKSLFQQKINLLLQNQIYHKFQKYVALKRILLNKNKSFFIISNQYKRQTDKKLSDKLILKLNQLQSDEQKRKRKYQVDKKSIQKNYQIPQQIVHRNSLLYTFQKIDMMPKIYSKNATFAEQYQTFLNNLQFTSQMLRRQQKVKDHYQIKSPSLMLKSSKKIKNPQKQHKFSISCLGNKDKEIVNDQVKKEFYRSIYNNFKVNSLESKARKHKSEIKKLTIYQ